jgi:hypothetical protein
MGIKEQRGKSPEAMTTPIAQAFFGGRFEHSVMGPIEGPVYGYDISSAYPYQLYQLPCLLHGKWKRHVHESGLSGSSAALVRYCFSNARLQSWAPFPFRDRHGSICYPSVGSGWAWLAEYQAGKRHFAGVEFIEAWVYHTDCDCRPFGTVAEYYRQRALVGKDAAGIVIKLFINSLYGKLAQSTGLSPQFQSWIWAGMVTAGTRAQLLDLMARAPRWSDILAVATDGIYSRVPLRCPKPVDTGTSDLAKPLGGWEEKVYPEGMFFLKPGIYFPLGDYDISDSLRARGVGRKALLKNRERIMKAYAAGKRKLRLPKIDRFFGCKSSVTSKFRRTERYGEWLKVPVDVSFECVNRAEGLKPKQCKGESVPYRKSMLNAEKARAILDEVIEYEQPM